MIRDVETFFFICKLIFSFPLGPHCCRYIGLAQVACWIKEEKGKGISLMPLRLTHNNPQDAIFTNVQNLYIYTYLYNNVTSMFIFIGYWLWSIKGHTQMASNPRQITSADLFFFFQAPPNPSINHLNFFCIKQIYYIFSPCVCAVIDHRRRHGV